MGNDEEKADDILGGKLGVAREMTGVARVSLPGKFMCTRGVDRLEACCSSIFECACRFKTTHHITK